MLALFASMTSIRAQEAQGKDGSLTFVGLLEIGHLDFSSALIVEQASWCGARVMLANSASMAPEGRYPVLRR